MIDMQLNETIKFLEKECISICGHGANENCICKIALCFKELEKSKKIIETLKKHFIIKFSEELDYDGNVWGRLVSFQWVQDKGNWDTTATANLANYKEEFDALKECFSNEQTR